MLALLALTQKLTFIQTVKVIVFNRQTSGYIRLTLGLGPGTALVSSSLV